MGECMGKYWRLGEGRENNTEGNTQLRLYSSADLMNWHYEGTPVDSETSGDTGTYFPECNAKGERAKIAKNYKGDWIIWAHWETNQSYGASRNVVLSTKGKQQGPYKLASSYVDVDGNINPGGFRRGAANNDADVMRDRVGQLIPDYDTADVGDLPGVRLIIDGREMSLPGLARGFRHRGAFNQLPAGSDRKEVLHACWEEQSGGFRSDELVEMDADAGDKRVGEAELPNALLSLRGPRMTAWSAVPFP